MLWRRKLWMTDTNKQVDDSREKMLISVLCQFTQRGHLFVCILFLSLSFFLRAHKLWQNRHIIICDRKMASLNKTRSIFLKKWTFILYECLLRNIFLQQWSCDSQCKHSELYLFILLFLFLLCNAPTTATMTEKKKSCDFQQNVDLNVEQQQKKGMTLNQQLRANKEVKFIYFNMFTNRINGAMQRQKKTKIGKIKQQHCLLDNKTMGCI